MLLDSRLDSSNSPDVPFLEPKLLLPQRFQDPNILNIEVFWFISFYFYDKLKYEQSEDLTIDMALSTKPG